MKQSMELTSKLLTYNYRHRKTVRYIDGYYYYYDGNVLVAKVEALATEVEERSAV